VLDTVLGKLARQHDPHVLVGFETADDAGVYQLSDDVALVQTVDFFTPIVDDPFTFGQIAAVNSLSDVYAMGGRPLSSLAMVCFPESGDTEVLERILAGGLSKMVEARCTVIGGHSVRDPEIKFGYSVTGSVHPDNVWKNSTARAGDVLVLTKPLGTGVISTAIKRNQAQPAWIDGAVASMTTLNKRAVEVIHQGGFIVHAATDVTGFGLIGHVREMALGAKVSVRIIAQQVPALPGAQQCIRAGFVPGGLKANREFAECVVRYSGDVEQETRTLLYDPQTAGGLLLSVPSESAHGLITALELAGVPAMRIGEVIPKSDSLIEVH
jgi:selenide, water dikinase